MQSYDLTMSDLKVTPERLAHLTDALRLNDAHVRVLHQNYSGPLAASESPSSLTVGGTAIEVPASAVIRRWTRDGKPGIEINSDAQPEPPGTWVRVVCEAAKQCNEVFETLEAL